MNQGKLEVVKQEMARVNIDILGISELKWNGMGASGGRPHPEVGRESREPLPEYAGESTLLSWFTWVMPKSDVLMFYLPYS